MKQKWLFLYVLAFILTISVFSQEIDWSTNNEILESGHAKREASFYIGSNLIRVSTQYYRVIIEINKQIVATIEPDMLSSIPSSSSIRGDIYFNVINMIPEDVKICYSKRKYYNSMYYILYFLISKNENDRVVKIIMIQAYDDSVEYKPSDDNIYYLTEKISPP